MRASHPLPSRRQKGDILFKYLTLAFAAGAFAFLALIGIELIRGSWPSLSRFGLAFLTTSAWDPVAEVFGVLPLIYGTVASSLLALFLAIPVSLGTAIFLSELAPGFLRRPLSLLVELLAAIPSVVYGLWGVLVLAPWLRESVQGRLGVGLGFLPLFQGPPLGIGMMAAGVILAIMILPIITSVAKDVMAAVPAFQREGMIALGATPWEVISKAVLPYARSGIIGGIILGLGRALGETMAVTMVIGNRPQVSPSLFSPAATLASVPANEFAEATSPLHVAALIEIGLVLLVITFAVNALARLLVWRAGGRHEG